MEQPEHEFWMRQALALAGQAEKLGEIPVGALVVRDGQLIGTGFNRPIASHDPTAHAEIVAMRDAAERLQNYRLPDSVLYVTIEPCTMCVGAMLHARVDTLVFGATEPRAGAVVSQLELAEQGFFNHRIKVVAGVLDEECGAMMQEFFRRRRSIA